MDVREAHGLLSQLEQDLANEPDSEVRAWYKLETELQPDLILARKTIAEATAVAGLIGRVAELKSEQAADSPTQGSPGLETDSIIEQPRILTPEEILRQRIEKRYRNCLKQYQEEIAGISVVKKGKREYQERMARRNFARQFSDFSDTTKDEHIALRPDLLALVADEVFDGELLDEVFAASANYAQAHAVEVTADPKRFAELISASVAGRPHSQQFEEILKAIFSTAPSNLADISINMGHATFELLEDPKAIEQLVSLVILKKDYVPTAILTEHIRRVSQLLAQGEVIPALESLEIIAMNRILNFDVARLNHYVSPRLRDLYLNGPSDAENALWTGLDTPANPALDELSALNELGQNQGGVGILYDPVETRSLETGQPIDIGLKEISDDLKNLLDRSTMFQERMHQLAPYSYSKRLAEKVLQSKGFYHQVIPLSPGLSVDVCLPTYEDRPLTDEEHAQIRAKVKEFCPNIMQTAVRPDLGVQAYSPGGKLELVYQKIFADADDKAGIAIYRPSVPLDVRSHSPLQRLAVNHATVLGTNFLEGRPRPTLEEYGDQNAELRRAIKAEQKRFLGRRPVRFPMNSELKKTTNLISVSLRMDQQRDVIKALIELDDGKVDLDLDRDFNIKDTDRVALVYPDTQSYYENLILKLARLWACKNEIQTSEGVVSERSGNSANMGHYAYLRIREDSYRYHFSETQYLACMEEQAKDLASESQRLQSLDPTGRGRNSTYVRENYDPSKPPLEVYAQI